ncbi:helix-turn-helix domain-containing protein [Xylanimonas ulmi]|uniref:Transcriptional regulator with XRE-family HTH domain n=1 Tax=Xylanimonas ulmi TaxID=228973 RepID=A0A4V2EXR8_9MICO|nr:helix-turn-helix transcriptional regulator [Xylanibacterium ulmi]RZS60440.1 transcriptional regulator with XRE-family HTH domain [Xylanibacterium ulmi]
MTQGAEWAQKWAESIGESLQRLRKLRGVSAQQLSERCATIGYPIARNTIANIENGRKRDVPVQEVAVLAAALGSSPVELLFPVLSGSKPVEALPNRSAYPVLALEWFAGSDRKVGNRYIGDPYAPEEWLPGPRAAGKSDLLVARTAFRMALVADEAMRNLAAARLGAEDPTRVTLVGAQIGEGLTWGDIAETWERSLHRSLRDLQRWRCLARRQGVDPGPLPPRIVEAYAALGGDDVELAHITHEDATSLSLLGLDPDQQTFLSLIDPDARS